MHWLSVIVLLWAAVYLVSVLTALVVRAVVPTTPFGAAMAGLVVGLLGVFLVVGYEVDRQLRGVVGERLGRERPTIALPRDGEFGGIVDELREKDHRGSATEDRSE